MKAPKPHRPARPAPDTLEDAIARLGRIAALNDALRRTMVTGRVMLTRGVACLPREELRQLLQAVRDFDAFTPSNDPYGFHDFGAIDLGPQTYFWKIDCYDLDLTYASPDQADPGVTRRVLTVMCAEEY